jgi:hypothetical protein
MNNTYSFKRFAMLFKKHTLEHTKIYLLSAGVLTGLLFVVLGFMSYTNRGELPAMSQVIVFYFFLVFAGCIFTSLSFSALGNKRKSIPVLTLPASTFEKYLVAWIYSFFVFQLFYIGIFFLVDALVLSLSVPANGINHLISLFKDDELKFGFFIVYTFFHSLAIWGSVFFEKMHFIKTAFVFFACIVVLVLVNQLIVNSIINGSILKNIPFEDLHFIEAHKYYSLQPQTGLGRYSLMIAVAVCTPLLWGSAFFQLKEKEV